MADTQEEIKLTLETIPNCVLALIMNLLPPKDCLNLRAASIPLRNNIKELIGKDIWRPSPELPLVLLDLSKCFEPPKKESSECFFSLSTNEVHHLDANLLESTQTITGSFDGWFIVADYCKKKVVGFFFFNPLTNERIMITPELYLNKNSQKKKKPKAPPLPRELYAKKMVSSIHPSSYVSDDSTDCYLAGIFGSVLHV
ncbi:uncharacterized protein LOC123904986 [Trifolium pratense]|uniref:uncharacterized protein LOC123904986 n=1 Tax=Trifolium pratense TaxID=57577 RepID=UPI001E6976CC|nr:uncharacterized protein LOC123904986 [Trifolium pratense]